MPYLFWLYQLIDSNFLKNEYKYMEYSYILKRLTLLTGWLVLKKSKLKSVHGIMNVAIEH